MDMYMHIFIHKYLPAFGDNGSPLYLLFFCMNINICNLFTNLFLYHAVRKLYVFVISSAGFDFMNVMKSLIKRNFICPQLYNFSFFSFSPIKFEGSLGQTQHRVS